MTHAPRIARASTGVAGINVRVPEGHTIHRLAGRHRALFAGRPVAVSSPQGRFADGAAASTAGSCSHLRPRQTPAAPLRTATWRCTSTSACTASSPTARGRRREPVGAGAAAAGRATGTGSTCAARRPASCSTRREVAALRARLGPDPLRDDADPAGRVRRGSRRSRTALAALLMDQTVVAGVGLIYRDRGAVPGRAVARPCRAGELGPARLGRDSGTTCVALMRDGRARRPDRHRPH